MTRNPGPARTGLTTLAFALLLAGAGTPAPAEVIPPRGGADARIRVMPYDPADVIRIDAFVGYQIHFEFAEGETFVNLGTGDRDGIDVGREANHLFIKPRAARVGTNITLLTNRRAYHLHYTARDKVPDPRRDDVIYSVRFTYPQDEARAREAAERTARARAREAAREQALREAAALAPRNLDYEFCGAQALRPTEAFDDGVRTHLRFGAQAEIPAIFLRNDDGTESLVNHTVQRDAIVLHRVARQWVLRRGSLVACVRNAVFHGGGTRLDTGTIHPGIERALRDPATGEAERRTAPAPGRAPLPFPADEELLRELLMLPEGAPVPAAPRTDPSDQAPDDGSDPQAVDPPARRAQAPATGLPPAP